MIMKLKDERFILENTLKTDFGIPQYVLDAYSESQLAVVQERIKRNPWSCYDKENGFGINLCKKIADKLDFNNDYEKCKAYIQYAIDKVADQGHCYAKEWQINQVLSPEKFTDYDKQRALDFLTKENILYVAPSGNYYLDKYYLYEKTFAQLLNTLGKKNGKKTGFKKHKCESYYQLNDNQRKAVDAVETNSLIILTGLPGTGKTTTIKAIVDCYSAYNDNIKLFAPTGKAASRMMEMCNVPAFTLHSWFSPVIPSEARCQCVENSIIILDELSMCDVEIAAYFAQAVQEDCVLILVGDPDQLPSVGPGQILQDVLDSGVGTRYHLNQIMRQKPGSIIKTAHSIHSGNYLVCDDDKELLTYHPKEWNLESIVSQILKHPEWKDAQFLSVLREKGSVIVNNLVQQTLHPHNIHKFRVGDKVIHTKNNKELGVFNGEMGKVVKVGQFVYVQFRDKLIPYPHHMTWQLDLAYCITIHKSQGSEFDKVVLFVTPSQITTRNLLYTGITRAKQRALIVSPSSEVVKQAIANKQKPRQTSMSWLIKKGVDRGITVE